MFKKALKLKLRFQTSVGNLSLEQVMDLKPSQLREEIKKAYRTKKNLEGTEDEELAFLVDSAAESKELEIANLKYNILKEIYNDKKKEIEDAKTETATNEEIKRLERLLAEKIEEEEKKLSAEEIQKKILELKEGKK